AAVASVPLLVAASSEEGRGAVAQRTDDRAGGDIGQLLSGALEDSLGVGEALTATVDPSALGRALAGALARVARRPWRAIPALGNAGKASVTAAAAVGARLAGLPVDPPLRPASGDRRFDDPAWEHDLRYQALRQAYLIVDRLLEELVA